MLEHLSTSDASSNGDHSQEGSIREQIEAPINTHQSSADQIFIQEEMGGIDSLPACLSIHLLAVSFCMIFVEALSPI